MRQVCILLFLLWKLYVLFSLKYCHLENNHKYSFIYETNRMCLLLCYIVYFLNRSITHDRFLSISSAVALWMKCESFPFLFPESWVNLSLLWGLRRYIEQVTSYWNKQLKTASHKNRNRHCWSAVLFDRPVFRRTELSESYSTQLKAVSSIRNLRTSHTRLISIGRTVKQFQEWC
jgi:hypothetical protein